MLRLADAEELDRNALACAVAGASCVVLGAALNILPPHLEVATFTAYAAPIFFGIAGTRRSLRDRVKGALLGSIAGLATLVFGSSHPDFALAVSGGVIGFLVSRHAARERRSAGHAWSKELLALAAGSAALIWPFAVHALESIETFSQLSPIGPPVVAEVVAGGVLGLVMGMMAAPLHFAADGHSVADIARRLRPSIDGDLRALVMKIVDVRAHALKLLDHSRADAEVRRETRRGLDGVALTALELTERFSAVDQVLARMPLSGIDERIADLRTTMDAATDAAVRRDLERALTALADQRSQLERLMQSKQRLIARLQSELASLEKTEMALAVLISGDAAVAGLRLEALGSSLGRQAQELEAEGSALQEALLLTRPSVPH